MRPETSRISGPRVRHLSVSISLWVLALLAASCAVLQGGHRVGPPSVDRCAGQPEGMRASCEQAREAAVKFAHGLATDDQICIGGIHCPEETLGDIALRALGYTLPDDGQDSN